jgi:hypothetical protein
MAGYSTPTANKMSSVLLSLRRHVVIGIAKTVYGRIAALSLCQLPSRVAAEIRFLRFVSGWQRKLQIVLAHVSVPTCILGHEWEKVTATRDLALQNFTQI